MWVHVYNNVRLNLEVRVWVKVQASVRLNLEVKVKD